MQLLESGVVAGAFFLGLCDVFYGLVFILAWNVLGDKAAAYVALNVAGIPIYFTEAGILGLVSGLVWRAYHSEKTDRAWPELENRWYWFYGAAAASALRGLPAYPFMQVVRDAAIAYYSLFAHLTARIVQNTKQLKILALVLGAVVLVKMTGKFIATHLISIPIPGFQNAATSMFVSLLVVGSLLTMPLWGRKHRWWYVIIIVAFSQVVDYRVRSTWIGIFAFVIYFLIITFRFRLAKTYLLRSAVLMSLGVGLSLIEPAANWEKTYLLQSPDVVKTSTTTLQSPDDVIARMESAPAPIVANHSGAPSSIRSNPGLNHVSQRWLNRDLIVTEFTSLFHGRRSPNVMTRLFLWTDTVEDTFSLSLPVLTKRKRDLRTLLPLERYSLEYAIGPVLFPFEIHSAWARFLVSSPLLRAFTGAPFGEKFVPSRVFYWMTSTARYDPHNSHLAILHRVGLIGFGAYLSLIVITWRRGMRFAKQLAGTEAGTLMMALMGCFLYHLVHSLSDVSLENPYKGIYFWVLMGLIQALQAMPLPDNSPLENSHRS